MRVLVLALMVSKLALLTCDKLLPPQSDARFHVSWQYLQPSIHIATWTPFFVSTLHDAQSHVPVTTQIISIAPRALEHLLELKKSKGDKGIILRMGVRSGGCSGLSYVMDLVEESAVMEEDMIEEYPEVSNSFQNFLLIIYMY
jgi:hypothetical protein